MKKMVTEHRREMLELEEQKFSKVTLASAAREVCLYLRVKLIEVKKKVTEHRREMLELEE